MNRERGYGTGKNREQRGRRRKERDTRGKFLEEESRKSLLLFDRDRGGKSRLGRRLNRERRDEEWNLRQRDERERSRRLSRDLNREERLWGFWHGSAVFSGYGPR